MAIVYRLLKTGQFKTKEFDFLKIKILVVAAAIIRGWSLNEGGCNSSK